MHGGQRDKDYSKKAGTEARRDKRIKVGTESQNEERTVREAVRK